LVGLELKSRTGGLSKAQREMRELFQAVGARYARVRTLEDVQNELQMAGVPLHARVDQRGVMFLK
jgi:hypothetical protein